MTYRERIKEYKKYNRQMRLLAEDVAIVFDFSTATAKQLIAEYMEGNLEYENSYSIPDFHAVCEYVRKAMEEANNLIKSYKEAA